LEPVITATAPERQRAIAQNFQKLGFAKWFDQFPQR
jgi:hypothetical protein